GGSVVVGSDAGALLGMGGVGGAVGGELLVRDLERLLEADGPPQGPADLEEDLIGDVVVRGDEQLDEDLRKSARLVDVDRLKVRGHRPGRDLALHAAAGLLVERRYQPAPP